MNVKFRLDCTRGCISSSCDVASCPASMQDLYIFRFPINVRNRRRPYFVTDKRCGKCERIYADIEIWFAGDRLKTADCLWSTELGIFQTLNRAPSMDITAPVLNSLPWLKLCNRARNILWWWLVLYHHISTVIDHKSNHTRAINVTVRIKEFI